ncbi:MAG: hypothetical protein KUG77_18400 [Nannocystaceae bacterium]|nr:hypothetical protein [Nannocystaceae bacterium]
MLPLLALTGCDPDSEPVGQSDTGGSGSDSQSESGDSAPGSSTGDSASDSETSPSASDSATTVGTSTTGGASTTGDPSGSSGSTGPSETTGIEECEILDCAPCPEGTVLEEYCGAQGWVCDCVPAGGVCDLPTYVDAAAAGKTVPEDCGTVSLADPDEAYVAAHDCVIAASTAQQAYRVVAQIQGIDATVWLGYAGSVGFVYSESNFSYEGGGFGGGEFIWRMDCTPEPLDGCAPSSSSGICLTCQGENNLVCSDPDA